MSKRAACKSANQQLGHCGVQLADIAAKFVESTHLRQRHLDGEGDDQCAVLHADGRVHAVAELVAYPLHHRIGQRARL